MKVNLLVTIIAACILNLGCTLSDNLLRTSVVQPLKYSSYWDEKFERRRFRKIAKLELERARCLACAESDNYGCPPFSIDQEEGFEAGFVDYLMYGGTGNPPPMPPRRYWWSGCETHLACSSIEDWYRGFQHGADVAQASGYRSCVTVPPSDSLYIDTRPHYLGGVQEASYVEPIIVPPGELDEASGAEMVVPELPSTSSAEEIPVPEGSLPEKWEASLRQGIFPIVDVSDGVTLNRPDGTASSGSLRMSQEQPPAAITAALPFDARTMPTAPSPNRTATMRTLVSPPALHAARPPLAGHPELIETHRLPSVDPPPARLPSPILSAPETDPMKGTWPHSETDGLIELETVPLSEPVPNDGPGKFRSSGAAFPPTSHRVADPPALSLRMATRNQRWSSFDPPVLGGTLFLVAGGIMLVRRSRVVVSMVAVSTDATPVNDVSKVDVFAGNVSGHELAPNVDAEPTSMMANRRIDSSQGNPDVKHREEYLPRNTENTTRCWTAILSALVACLFTGCASLTNPVLNGIPVRKLPEDYLSQPHRDELQTVPLSLLRQEQPDEYLLGPGDVVGVYIAGVFPPTLADQPLTTPPVYFPSQIDPIGAGLPPSMGYPLTIRNDGTLPLPLVDPINVAGLTAEEANKTVADAYSQKGILQPGRESVLLTLMQPRQVRVLVFRQEVGGFSAGGRGDISSNTVKQGTGHVINLRAYENDVVNALVNSGGLPGLDTYAGVYIFRGGESNPELMRRLQSSPSSEEINELSGLGVETDYIPVRWPISEPLPFQRADVVVNDGDVVLVEARNEDLFYTAGLLPAGQRVLPRDYDLDVVEAVVQVSGTLVNGAFGGNNFNGLLIQKGIGNPNPSALTVIRRTPNGGQIPIAVDLNRALVDPRERILVQAGDILILQETRQEAVARYFSTVFNFNIFWQAFSRGDASGAAAVTQLPSI